jgi:hypothetical protein
VADPIRRFELFFLRPLWAVTVLVTVAAAVKAQWWWAAGGVLAIPYVGVIGAKLHPSLTAAQLSDGPLTGEAAVRESAAMHLTDKNNLVAHACNRVAHLMAFVLAAYLMAVAGWRWYLGLPAAFFGSALLGGLLRVAFAERNDSDV